MLQFCEADQPVSGRALVVMAHPDDIEYFVGGTLAAWAAAGVAVTAVLATSGEHGSPNTVLSPPEVAMLREREQREACATLGIQDAIFLREPDGTLQPTLDLRLRLVRIIRRVCPDVVVLPDPMRYYFDGYVNHPDHRAIGEAALAAVSPAAANHLYHPELVEEGLRPHRVRELWLALAYEPNCWVDITTVLPRKLAAMRCHQSQIADWASMELALQATTRTVLAGDEIVHRESYRRIRIA
jgi:LmbE family N-acetylglucosaminyl deacetylase